MAVFKLSSNNSSIITNKTQTYIGAYSNQTGRTIINFLLSHNFAKILFSISFQIYWTHVLCSCVVGRRKQYGRHHESDLRGCRAVVQRSWYDSSPVKCLEVSLVRVWPRRLVKAMFSLNCLAIRKLLLISGPLPSRTKLRDRVSDHDVVSPSLLQCAFCGHYRHISCIFKTFVR